MSQLPEVYAFATLMMVSMMSMVMRSLHTRAARLRVLAV